MEGEELINMALQESDSQKDKSGVDTLKSLTLIDFIQKQLDKATSKDTLRSSILDKLKSRVNNSTNPERELDNVELIKLLEILEKTDNEMTSIIFENLKDVKPPKKDEADDLSFNASDINKFKDLLKYVDYLAKVEGGKEDKDKEKEDEED
jgi:uncharacterized protein YdiU (UPF0061 family)